MQFRLLIKCTVHFVLFSYLFVVTYLILKFTKQTYGVNDDVIIQSWLSGSYTGNPELMIRGSATPKMLFGLIVSNLYKIAPSINWYSIVILCATLISWYLIGLCIVKKQQILITVFYVLISFIYLLWFIPSPTYTASAILLTFSSLIFLMYKIKTKLIFVFFISLLFSFAYLMRPESFFFASAVCAPAFFYFVWSKLKKNNKKIILFILFTLGIIVVDYSFETYFYKNNTSWSEYKTFENLRYQIQANNPEKLLLSDPLSFGWTFEDAKLFENYITIDKNVFNNDKYLNVLNNVPKNTIESIWTFFIKGHEQLINSDVNWEWFRLASLIPLSFSFFLFLSWPRIKKFLLISTSSYAIGYFVMIYVATFLRQPERVQVSAIFLAILVPLLSFVVIEAETGNQKSKFNANSILSVLIIVLIFNQVYSQAKYLDKKYSGANNVFWINQVEFLSKFPKESIFIGNASMVRNNWINPYKMSNFEVENQILTLGWHNFSPHWDKRAKNLGLNPNEIFNDVITKNNVYWLSDPVTIEFVTSFLISNNYISSKPILVDKIDFVNDEYGVWKFSK